MSKAEVLNLISHPQMLLMFRGYVDQCIEDNTPMRLQRPLSFDEWYNREFLPKIDDHTSVVTFVLYGEGASGGQLSGRTEKRSFKCRIPCDIVTETGGIMDGEALAVCAKRLTVMQNERLPSVEYMGKLAYNWTRD